MSIALSNVETTDTFQIWLNRVNDAVNFISTQALHANAATGQTTGNAQLIGIFQANTIAATQLRGGTVASSDTLTIVSDVNIDGGGLQFANTEVINSSGGWVGDLAVSGNVSGTYGLFGTAVNTALFSVGSAFTANSTVVNAAAYHIGTAMVFNTTDANTSANVSLTGTNANVAANLYVTGVNGVNAAAFKVGTAFTANATVVNAVSLRCATQFKANTTGVYVTGTAGVNSVAFSVGSDFIANTTMIVTTGNVSMSDDKHILFGNNDSTSLGYDDTENDTVMDLVDLDQNFLIKENANTRFTFEGNTGNFTASGDITAFSDVALKENIIPIESALDLLEKVKGVYYQRKDGDRSQKIGLIAQEVEQYFPEVVHEVDGYKTIAYGNLVAVLIQAVNELRNEVKRSPT